MFLRSETGYHVFISFSFRQLRKAIEDVNSGVLLGASAHATSNMSDHNIEDGIQSTTERESEIGKNIASNIIE